MGGQGAFLTSAASQLPSGQNNSYAQVAYFGVAYSTILHSLVSSLRARQTT